MPAPPMMSVRLLMVPSYSMLLTIALIAAAMPCIVPMIDEAMPAIWGTGSSARAFAVGIRKPTPNMYRHALPQTHQKLTSPSHWMSSI